MRAVSETTGLIIVLDQEAIPESIELAARQGWTILRTWQARHVVPAVLRRPVDTVMIQVSELLEEAAELVAQLHASPRRIRVAILSLQHGERAERAMRAAGADCYLAGRQPLWRITEAIEALRARPTHSRSSTTAKGLRMKDMPRQGKGHDTIQEESR